MLGKRVSFTHENRLCWCPSWSIYSKLDAVAARSQLDSKFYPKERVICRIELHTNSAQYGRCSWQKWSRFPTGPCMTLYRTQTVWSEARSIASCTSLRVSKRHLPTKTQWGHTACLVWFGLVWLEHHRKAPTWKHACLILSLSLSLSLYAYACIYNI